MAKSEFSGSATIVTDTKHTFRKNVFIEAPLFHNFSSFIGILGLLSLIVPIFDGDAVTRAIPSFYFHSAAGGVGGFGRGFGEGTVPPSVLDCVFVTGFDAVG